MNCSFGGVWMYFWGGGGVVGRDKGRGETNRGVLVLGSRSICCRSGRRRCRCRLLCRRCFGAGGRIL